VQNTNGMKTNGDAAVALEFPIPSTVYRALNVQELSQEQIIQDIQRSLALHYFREQVLSRGQAARLAGMSTWSFIEFLSSNNVPVIDMDEEEFAQEVETVKWISQQLHQQRAEQ